MDLDFDMVSKAGLSVNSWLDTIARGEEYAVPGGMYTYLEEWYTLYRVVEA